MNLKPFSKKSCFSPSFVCAFAILLAGQLSGMCGPISDAILQGINIANQQQQQDQANAAAQQQAQAAADAAAAQQQADAAQQQAQADAIAAQRAEHEAMTAKIQARVNQQGLENGAYIFNDNHYGMIAIVLCTAGGFANPNQFDASKYTDIKTAFSDKEDVCIHVSASTKISNFRMKVYDASGNSVRNKLFEGAELGVGQTFSAKYRNALPPGRYTFGLYVEDTLLKKVDFTITGNAQQPEPLPTTAQTTLPKGAYEYQDPKYGHIEIVTCNYYVNFEGDNIAHLPDDYVGIKHYFSAREKITIMFTTGVKQSGYGIKIWNENGDLVNSFKSNNESSAGINFVSTPNTPQSLKPSSYVVAFYHDDELIKKITLEVGK